MLAIYNKKILFCLLFNFLLLFIGCPLSNFDSFEPGKMTTYAPIIIDDVEYNDSKNIKVAVIVEPREIPSLIPVIKNVIAKLGDGWVVQVFHGLLNETIIKDNLEAEISSGKVVLSKMYVEKMSANDYNGKILHNPYFWGKVIGETILLFEADTVLCSNSTYDINYFLSQDYFYIGAPWPVRYGCYIYSKPDIGFRFIASSRITDKQSLENLGYNNIQIYRNPIGNSGLSLFKKSIILKIIYNFISESTYFNSRASDLFYSCALSELGLKQEFKLPSIDVAKTFSVESLFYGSPFGVHKPWLALSNRELKLLGENCPELNTILKPTYKF